MKNEKNFADRNRLRCVNALILCAIVIIGVFVGVVMKLVAPSTVEDPDEGLRTFRYFTALSNMLMAFTAAMCIPFEIEGLRSRNYHLPRWAVGMLYFGVCGTTVTFVIAVCILAPAAGFGPILFQRANLYLHMICPLAGMTLFIFVNDEYRVPFHQAFLFLIMLFAYAFVYWLEVFVIGEENGGWRDHYYTNVYVPYWVVLAVLPFIGLGLADAIRVLHNRMYERRQRDTEEYFLTGQDLACGDVLEAAARLADYGRQTVGEAIVVPLRQLRMLKKRYHSDLPETELCAAYLAARLKKED